MSLFFIVKLFFVSPFVLKVTNHTVGAGGEGGKTKPALGETWKSIPHVRLMLSRDQKNSNCTISILKHTSMVLCSPNKCYPSPSSDSSS